MELALDLTALRGLLVLQRLGYVPQEALPYRFVPGDICADCGAPVCAGIRALHRSCPARNTRPLYQHSAPRRRRSGRVGRFSLTAR
jgi:hypothetical protein